MKRRKKANLPAPDAPNAGFGLFIDIIWDMSRRIDLSVRSIFGFEI